jgi:hypothetical protein
MNIVLDINIFTLENIYFLEPRSNIVMDGTFSKILYSNDYMSLNGIFFNLPLDRQNDSNVGICNKNILKFYPSSATNNSFIQELAKIEYKIIDYYRQMNNCNKKIACSLSKQLYSGKLKIYKDHRDNIDVAYIVKLSGIWESSEEIGITYKVFEVGSSI